MKEGGLDLIEAPVALTLRAADPRPQNLHDLEDALNDLRHP